MREFAFRPRQRRLGRGAAHHLATAERILIRRRDVGRGQYNPLRGNTLINRRYNYRGTVYNRLHIIVLPPLFPSSLLIGLLAFFTLLK